jgi:hypothetical protein
MANQLFIISFIEGLYVSMSVIGGVTFSGRKKWLEVQWVGLFFDDSGALWIGIEKYNELRKKSTFRVLLDVAQFSMRKRQKVQSTGSFYGYSSAHSNKHGKKRQIIQKDSFSASYRSGVMGYHLVLSFRSQESIDSTRIGSRKHNNEVRFENWVNVY